MSQEAGPHFITERPREHVYESPTLRLVWRRSDTYENLVAKSPPRLGRRLMKGMTEVTGKVLVMSAPQTDRIDLAEATDGRLSGHGLIISLEITPAQCVWVEFVNDGPILLNGDNPLDQATEPASK